MWRCIRLQPSNHVFFPVLTESAFPFFAGGAQLAHMHTYTHAHTHTRTCTRTHTHTRMCAYALLHTHRTPHTHMHVHTHHTHTCTHIHTPHSHCVPHTTHTHTHARVHTHTHTHTPHTIHTHTHPPDYKEPLKAGGFNLKSCPGNHSALCTPARLWLSADGGCAVIRMFAERPDSLIVCELST